MGIRKPGKKHLTFELHGIGVLFAAGTNGSWPSTLNGMGENGGGEQYIIGQGSSKYVVCQSSDIFGNFAAPRC